MNQTCQRINLLTVSLLCLLIALASLVGCGAERRPRNEVERGGAERGLHASRIFDGDSLVLSNGQEVRLIGIDAPEKGQPYADEARDFLKGLISGKALRIETGVEERDKYKRLLVYMYTGDTFINAEMIKAGYAVTLFIPPNEKYKEEFTKLEADAKQTKRLIWSKVYITPNGDKYHNPCCRHLREREVKAISLSEAKNLKKEPCKDCLPPTEEKE